MLKFERPVISAITEIELLSWKSGSEEDTNLLNGFINDALVIELEKAIKIKSADLRKAHRIKLPDAIIAATALVHGLILITRNVDDFKNIMGITIVDPWNI